MELKNSGKEVMKESSFSPFVSVGMPRQLDRSQSFVSQVPEFLSSILIHLASAIENDHPLVRVQASNFYCNFLV